MSASAAAASASLAAGTEGQYCFLVEWFDAQAAIMRQYHLLFFVVDDTIEMFDLKNRRTFLKRCAYPSISLADLYIGAQVSVYSRLLRILDYGDQFTQSKLAVVKGRSIALVKPAGYESWGRIISAITRGGFKLGRMKSLRLSPVQAQTFYGDRQPSQRALELAAGPVLALEIIGAGVQQALLQAASSSSSSSSSQSSSSFSSSSAFSSSSRPSSQQQQSKSDLSASLAHVHVATSERSAESELEFLFGGASSGLASSTATFTSCTLAVLKPHVVQSGSAGDIIDAILGAGFDIAALELFTLDKGAAEEFMEVYKGVVPEYFGLVEQLTSGPLIAMEIRAPRSRLVGADGAPLGIVQAFRNIVGPADPEVARHIRPKSLRAIFGQNKLKNAIHCTDLEEDGVLESQFFFDILQQTVTPTTASQQAAQQRR